MINTLIVVYFFFFLIHTIVFLLYQFDVVNIRERSMVYWIRAVNIIETLFLAITHIFTFSSYGTYFLGAIYLLNITLLVLQFIFVISLDFAARFCGDHPFFLFLFVFPRH